MKLEERIRQLGLTQLEYGKRIDSSQQAVARYCKGRIPSRAVMTRIYYESGGQVTPNDFYDLPAIRPAKRRERAA